MFPEASIQRFDNFLSLNEFNWVGQNLLEKFNALSGELAVEGKSPILTYIEFLDEFLGSLKKILKEETINKIDSFCQDTLYGLV